MDDTTARRPAVTAAIATAVLGLVALTVVLAVAPAGTAAVVDDLAQLAAAVAATVACLVAASRPRGLGMRVPWSLLAASAGAWAAAQAWWTTSVHLRGIAVPYPSIGDVGFLGSVALGGAGVLVWSARHGWRRNRVVRELLDGGIIAASFVVVVWVLALSDMWSRPGTAVLELTLSTLYPVADIAVATIALLAAARAPVRGRLPLVLVSAGLMSLAVSDTAFLYATQAESYGSGDLLGVGWVLGFLLLAAGALAPDGTAGRRPGRHERRQGLWGLHLLPYVPLTLAIAVVAEGVHDRDQLTEGTLWAVLLLFALVLARQLLVLLDNRSLLRRLSHDAHVDALTGLANRRAVEARLVRAMAQDATRPFAEVAVLMFDVNGLKRANDQFGHDAGDEVLRRVGDLLLAAVRDEVTDPERTEVVVGRIGGDEFAVVLTGRATGALGAVRDRIDVEATSLPYGAGLSSGSGRLTTVPPNATTPHEMMRTLLRLADGELYAQKRGPAPTPVPTSPSPTTAPQALADLVVRVHDELAALADATVAARLAVCAGAFARAVDSAAWWVSSVTDTGTLDDVLSEQVRAPADPVAPARLSDLPTTTHALVDYPDSDATAHGRRSGFHVTQLQGPDEERTYLAATGYAQVLASGGLDADGCAWLVEVFGDAATDDLGVHLPLLRALVTLALASPTSRPREHDRQSSAPVVA
ncbi:MAG: GGDEF domain-containing protein [Nocardioidaceae bacterium]|nr:GGDEF domain-containing protein [Nocardioidaceae bacterium]